MNEGVATLAYEKKREENTDCLKSSSYELWLVTWNFISGMNLSCELQSVIRIDLGLLLRVELQKNSNTHKSVPLHGIL